MNNRPRCCSSCARRMESLKFELPPSMIKSPRESFVSSETISSSVIRPAGTIVHRTRGGCSAATSSSKVDAGAAPCAASSVARRGSASYTTTLWPPRSSRCAMLPPILPSPSIAICIESSPGATRRRGLQHQMSRRVRRPELHRRRRAVAASASRASCRNLRGSPSSRWTRSARLPRACSTSRSPRACAAKSVANP